MNLKTKSLIKFLVIGMILIVGSYIFLLPNVRIFQEFSISTENCGFKLSSENVISGIVIEGFSCGYHTNWGGQNTEFLGLKVDECVFYFITEITKQFVPEGKLPGNYETITEKIIPTTVGNKLKLKGILEKNDGCTYDPTIEPYYIIKNPELQ